MDACPIRSAPQTPPQGAPEELQVPVSWVTMHHQKDPGMLAKGDSTGTISTLPSMSSGTISSSPFRTRYPRCQSMVPFSSNQKFG